MACRGVAQRAKPEAKKRSKDGHPGEFHNSKFNIYNS
jgi:hypothetical protein